ncbi:hypothetical protein PFLUV_G00228440 [Perca fluviatilis]|uniref:Uncharacterized protein n=1 Tax=Perca fluviatilis TaxID=8168 RepID=A0A6A5DXH3_PERFL|nr:hypothetical protein PFLUV_G00228440 [Perca fluviatilis]
MTSLEYSKITAIPPIDFFRRIDHLNLTLLVSGEPTAEARWKKGGYQDKKIKEIHKAKFDKGQQTRQLSHSQPENLLYGLNSLGEVEDSCIRWLRKG